MPGRRSTPEERERRRREWREEHSQGPGNGSPKAPPVEAGNTLAVTHGARSETLLEPLAAAIEREARASADWPPHLAGPSRYDSEVAAWAWVEAVVMRLRQFLAESDPLSWLTETDSTDETVTVREGGSRRRSRTRREQSALEQLRRWEDVAGRRRAALGLNPVSAARLSRDLMAAKQSASVDMARLIADLDDEGELGT
ncbi:hypothetical protein SCMU_18340 [Sinomonas cyclohexanicum]|uniref:Uncharacterized protein n=1 Tax=Sinomonas cyclohexanicum TaxID=322009 RepID=A0ABM7PUQ8_SINCY|nr:hypothetical protein [Corynebacterium cyclohexanicum]BCT75992.1 hypothetical protein SCMU_18340 [Corynebacterium cyclohexanicum]